jgi:hypothetical protein
MASYHSFTAQRATTPDAAALAPAIRASCGDVSAGFDASAYPRVTVKKSSAWTEAQIAATQAALDAVPAATPQTSAQAEIDRWPVEIRALVLALVDQINIIRAQLPTPRPAITPQQAIKTIRDKAALITEREGA